MMTLKMVVDGFRNFDQGCLYIRDNNKTLVERLDYLHYGFQFPRECNSNAIVDEISIGNDIDDGIIIYIDLM